MLKFFYIVIFTIISTSLECCEVNLLNVCGDEVYVMRINNKNEQDNIIILFNGEHCNVPNNEYKLVKISKNLHDMNPLVSEIAKLNELIYVIDNNYEEKLFLHKANSDVKLLTLPYLKMYGKTWLNQEEKVPEKFKKSNEFRSTYELLLIIWKKKLKSLEDKIGIVEQQYKSENDKQRCITNVLYKSVKHKLPILVKLLLQRGAKKDKKDHLNNIPAYYLDRIEDENVAVEIAKLLITNRKDSKEGLGLFGSTVVTLATKYKRQKLLDYYKDLSQ